MTNKEKIRHMKKALTSGKAVLKRVDGKSVLELMYLKDIGFLLMTLYKVEGNYTWEEEKISDEMALEYYSNVVR